MILFPLQSACVDNPCDNNSTCQSGFTDKGYRCLCTTGFKGSRCEKGNPCHVKPVVSSCSLQFYTQLLKGPVEVKVWFFFINSPNNHADPSLESCWPRELPENLQDSRDIRSKLGLHLLFTLKF